MSPSFGTLHVRCAAGFVLIGLLLAQLAHDGYQSLPAARAAPSALPVELTLHVDRHVAPVIAGKRIATFHDALRVFGSPAAVIAGGGTAPACETSWPRLGLKIDFSVGAARSCATRFLGSWVGVKAVGKRWRTYAGLRVGDSERRLHDLYSGARRLDFLGQGRMWELETGGLVCDGGPTLALAAQVRVSRVAALAIVHVPSCG